MMKTVISYPHALPITTCELRFNTGTRQGLRIQCAEFSDAILIPTPVVRYPHPTHLAEMERLAKRWPVLRVRNPSGRLLTFEMQRFYEDQLSFDGTVPYYNQEDGTLVRIPADEIAAPYTYTLTPDGRSAFSDTEFSDQASGSDTLPEDFETRLERVYTVLREHILPEATSEVLIRSILESGDAKTLCLILERIATAYEQCVARLRMTSLERAECFGLLQLAPYVPANELMDATHLSALSKKRARKVIEAYHAVPGTPPPAHYYITVRADR